MGHGARIDECGSAAAHRVCGMVAGVNINPIFGEVVQTTQHHSFPGHFVLLDLKI